MLTENQLEKLPERLYERLNRINSMYLTSIGKAINKIGELRPSDVHKLQQIYNYGTDIYVIARELSVASEKNISEIYEMFDIVAKANYDYTKPFYEEKGLSFIPYKDNEKLQKYVQSIARQTVDEYVNASQHTAFAVFSDNTSKSIAPLFENNMKKVATSLSDTYTKVVDFAVTQVNSGVASYDTAMRSVLKALADSGIRTRVDSNGKDTGTKVVDYATGYSRRLDTAVRQNVLWGIKQCNQNTADIVGEEFGANGYEISYHSHPRPLHAEMGGRQYAIGKAKTVNGIYYPSFDSVKGLLQDYGCLHFKFSILLGISQPTYDEAQLEELKAADGKKIKFEGKEYTKYEASQLQRKIETEVRHQKDRATISKAANDKDMYDESQRKIKLLRSKYKQLSKASGLPTKMERMRVAVETPRANKTAKVIKSVDKAEKIIEKPKIIFTPSKTIDEAEHYAKRFIGDGYSKSFSNKASYSGISIDNANEINKALNELYSKYDMPKLNGLSVISPTSAKGKKIFSSTDAVAAYSPVEHGIFLNKDILKNSNSVKLYNKKSADAWHTVMTNINNLTGNQKEIALIYKNAGRSLVGDGSVHDYIVHEMGHHVQWNVLDAVTNNAVGNNMSKFAPRISGYANMSKGEYLAESFATFVRGEIDKVDPIFTDFMNKNIKIIDK